MDQPPKRDDTAPSTVVLVTAIIFAFALVRAYFLGGLYAHLAIAAVVSGGYAIWAFVARRKKSN